MKWETSLSNQSRTTNTSRVSPQPAIMVGAGGHAKVVCDSYFSQPVYRDIESAHSEIVGAVDPALAVGSDWYRGIKIIGDDSALDETSQTDIVLLNGLGQLPNDNGSRVKVYNKFKQQGFVFSTVVDQSAIVSPSVKIGEGAQLLAGVIVQADTCIGENCIVNTGAQIDHDCVIGDHTSISPSAVLCGGVKLGKNVFVGANAVIIQNVVIDDDAVIAAGSIVTKNVSAGQVVYPPRAENQGNE